MSVEIISQAGFGVYAEWKGDVADKLADKLGVVSLSEREDLAFSPDNKLSELNPIPGVSWDTSRDQWSGTFPTRLVILQDRLGFADKHSSVKDGLQGVSVGAPSAALLKAKAFLEEVGLVVSDPQLLFYSSVL